MSIEDKSFNEKLSLAINSTDANILTLLMASPSSKIRRAVARNHNTSKNVLKILAYDPVLNVSFKALENPNCDVDRCITEDLHPCVCCNIAEDKKNCQVKCKSGAFA